MTYRRRVTKAGFTAALAVLAFATVAAAQGAAPRIGAGQANRSGIQGLDQTPGQQQIGNQLRDFQDSQQRLRLKLQASRQYGESVHQGKDAGQAGSLYRQQMQRLNRSAPGGQTPFVMQQLQKQ